MSDAADTRRRRLHRAIDSLSDGFLNDAGTEIQIIDDGAKAHVSCIPTNEPNEGAAISFK